MLPLSFFKKSKSGYYCYTFNTIIYYVTMNNFYTNSLQLSIYSFCKNSLEMFCDNVKRLKILGELKVLKAPRIFHWKTHKRILIAFHRNSKLFCVHFFILCIVYWCASASFPIRISFGPLTMKIGKKSEKSCTR